MTDLDELLRTPLDTIVDGGFSHRIAARIAAEGRAFAWVEIGAAIAVLALVVLFAPFAGYARPIATAVVDLSTSVPFAIACAALVLSQALTRMFAD